MGIFSGLKAAYDRLCGRIEASADKLEAERLALKEARAEHKAYKDETALIAARAEFKDLKAKIAKADRLLNTKPKP